MGRKNRPRVEKYFGPAVSDWEHQPTNRHWVSGWSVFGLGVLLCFCFVVLSAFLLVVAFCFCIVRGLRLQCITAWMKVSWVSGKQYHCFFSFMQLFVMPQILSI